MNTDLGQKLLDQTYKNAKTSINLWKVLLYVQCIGVTRHRLSQILFPDNNFDFFCENKYIGIEYKLLAYGKQFFKDL